MKTATVRIPGSNEEAIPACIVDPGGPRRPAVIILHEIFGVNEAMQAEARQWAKAGYLCVVPHLFHRVEPDVSLHYTPEGRDKALSLWRIFDVKSGVSDVRAVAEWSQTYERCSGRIAVIGFCLGGQLALLAALEMSIDSVAAFYPVNLQGYISQLRQLSAPTLIHMGTRDDHIPPDVIEGVRRALVGKPNVAVKIYEGAQHAFYNPFRKDWYSPSAAQEAHDATASLLRSTLQSSPKKSPKTA